MRATMLPLLSFFPATDAAFLPDGPPAPNFGPPAAELAPPAANFAPLAADVALSISPSPPAALQDPAPSGAPLPRGATFSNQPPLSETAPLPERLAALAPQLRQQGSAAAWASLPAQLWRADEPGSVGASTECLPSGFAALDQALPGGGWPQGQLVELLLDAPGLGELGLLMPALACSAAQGRPAVWVLPHDAPAALRASGWTSTSASVSAPTLTSPTAPTAGSVDPLRHCPTHARPYAPALATAGIDLSRCIFVQPATPREALWTFEQALRAPHLGAVVGWLPDTTSHDAAFRALRRLHLMAQRHQALVFVLRPTSAAASPSPAAVRLQLGHAHGALQVQVLKRRGRPLLDPLSLLIPTQPAVPQSTATTGQRVVSTGRAVTASTNHRTASAINSASANANANASANTQAVGFHARFAGVSAQVRRLLPVRVATLLSRGASEPAALPNAACAS